MTPSDYRWRDIWDAFYQSRYDHARNFGNAVLLLLYLSLISWRVATLVFKQHPLYHCSQHLLHFHSQYLLHHNSWCLLLVHTIFQKIVHDVFFIIILVIFHFIIDSNCSIIIALFSSVFFTMIIHSLTITVVAGGDGVGTAKWDLLPFPTINHLKSRKVDNLA